LLRHHGNKRCATAGQGCQIGFFDAKFHAFGCLGAVGVKKLFGFLVFSFEYLAIFGGTWPRLSDWCFGFSNVFLKSVIRHFWTVVSAFSQKLSGNP